MTATSIGLEHVVKRYGDVEVIHGIDLTIEPGEFTVFVGPSGCGKSTLLRMIAGLEPITGGDLVIDGHSSDPRIPASDFRLARFAEADLLTTPYPYVGAGQMR